MDQQIATSITTLSKICPICNNLEESRSTDLELFDLQKWASQSQYRDCLYCRFIVEALRKLEPALFGNDSLPLKLNTKLSIGERGQVAVLRVDSSTIGGVPRSRLSRIADVQIYSTKGTVFTRLMRDLWNTHSVIEKVSEIPNMAACGEISAVPGDVNMWQFLKESLKECLESHIECQSEQETGRYPSRLLRLDSDRKVRLVETKVNPPSAPYAALSHCWGTEPTVRTLQENIDRFKDDVPFDILSRTFQDAIHTTLELGLNYLWIDSLCILQDDRSDWAIHAGKMDNIFANAHFTIAAVSSSNGTVPFLGPSAPNQRCEYQSIDIHNPLNPSQMLRARKYSPWLRPLVLYGPLENRAWTWQENHLSVRIIHMHSIEARWSCQQAQGCECIGALEARSAKSHRSVDSIHWNQQWQEIVNIYSRRLLTYSTDRLPALAGAASRFSSVARTEYLAGLWRSQFPQTLAWNVREPSDTPNEKIPLWYSLNNNVPSWSWGSVRNEVMWTEGVPRGPSMLQEQHEEVSIRAETELVQTDCRPSSENPFGEVQKGSWIELRGRVVEAEMKADPYGCACVVRDGFGPQLVKADCDIVTEEVGASWRKEAGIESRLTVGKAEATTTILRRAIEDDFSSRNDNHSIGPVLCLLLTTFEVRAKRHACVLVLGPSVEDATTYCRLALGSGTPNWPSVYHMRQDWNRWKGWGKLEEWADWERWFEGAQTKTVRII